MRQGAVLISFFLIAAIVGCGGSGGYKNAAGSLTTPALGSGGSSPVGSAPSEGTATGSTTSGSSSSSAAGSGAAGNGTGTSTASSTTSPTFTTSSSPEVVITSPADGATLSSPAQITASVTGPSAISSTQLYVDDQISFQTTSSQISTAVQLAAGAHTLVAQAWDQNGTSYKSAPVRILVQGGAAPAAPASPAPAPPAPAAPTMGQIQTQGGWDDCDICAGDAGNGPHTAHGMVQGVNSPSLSGAAARFDLGGTPWGAALWWHELGSHDDAQNLRYDLDFYIDSTSSAQALEFDVNQTAGGSKYIFGTECDFRGTGTWRVWNGPAHTWSSTGLSCSVPETNTWHHLTWEFQRSGGQAHFVAVTLDGNRQDVGTSFSGIGAGGSGLDVAFQADLNAAGGSESVWLDNVSLSW